MHKGIDIPLLWTLALFLFVFIYVWFDLCIELEWSSSSWLVAVMRRNTRDGRALAKWILSPRSPNTCPKHADPTFRICLRPTTRNTLVSTSSMKYWIATIRQWWVSWFSINRPQRACSPYSQTTRRAPMWDMCATRSIARSPSGRCVNATPKLTWTKVGHTTWDK